MAQQITLDDIAESIADLTNMMAGEFAVVRQEMTSGFEAVHQEMATKSEMGIGFTALRQEMDAEFKAVRAEIGEAKTEIRHVGKRLDAVEGTALASSRDIKEPYFLIDDLRKDIRVLTKDERQRLAELEVFAMQVAEKTGIPYIPAKRKRRP